MNRIIRIAFAALTFSASAAFAEKGEFAILGGGSFGMSKAVDSPSGDADAGFKNGFSAGIGITHNMYTLLGGELRYTYQRHDMKLTSSSTKVTFGAESHAVHYDLVLHGTPRGSRVRPYVAGGGGMKIYRGTGKEQAIQPLGNIAVLTRTTQTVGMVSVGAGVKFALSDKLQFRIDVHNYMSPVPKDVIAPVPPGKIGGWLHNIVPMAGIAFTF